MALIDESQRGLLEFSTDPLTVEANQLIAAKPDFVREFCDTLLKYELDSTFGLSAIKKPSGTEYELVEFNSEHRSILKESTQADTNGMTLIQTRGALAPMRPEWLASAVAFQNAFSRPEEGLTITSTRLPTTPMDSGEGWRR